MIAGSVNDKVIAITGGGRGIGEAIARALSHAGARVAVGDIDEANARRVADDIQGHAGRLDVRDADSFDQWLTAVEKELGPLDALINNAGIMPAGPFLEESPTVTDTQIDINLRGVILGCKRALPGMLARRSGHVVNVASMAGKLPVPGLSVYCATKFAVIGLTDSLREEYRDSGVRFTSILPAKVTTELSSGTDQAARGVPTVAPEDVAQAVLSALRHGTPEVAVPRYVAAAGLAQNVVPYALGKRFRQLFGDRRVLEQMDHQARDTYNQRLSALSGDDAG